MRQHDAAMLPAPKRCIVMCLKIDTSFWVNAYVCTYLQVKPVCLVQNYHFSSIRTLSTRDARYIGVASFML